MGEEIIMATNDFKAFSIGPGANVMSQSDWNNLAALVAGFQSGKASSAQINKALRQGTVIASLVAQFIADSSGSDVLDNGNTALLMTNFIAALKANGASNFLQKTNPLSEIASGGATAQATAVSNLGIAANLIPVGVPLPWPSATPPSGWIKCNGASFSVSLYPKLALAFPSGILPDLRGYFIRGWDDGRGIDVNRMVNTGQLPIVGSFQWSSSTYGVSGTTGPIVITDSITINGVSNDGGPVGTTSAVISPGDTRPYNVSFNYIVRAA